MAGSALGSRQDEAGPTQREIDELVLTSAAGMDSSKVESTCVGNNAVRHARRNQDFKELAMEHSADEEPVSHHLIASQADP